jgi:hypothetical protein
MKSVLIFLALLTVGANAQFNIGANLQSHYNFRGAMYSQAPVVCGFVDYTASSVSVLAGVTYNVTGTFSENVLVVKYRTGVFSLFATDYYYPYAPARFGNVQSTNKGAHYLEVGSTYEYKSLELLVSGIAYNDTTYSPYAQLTYRPNIGDAGNLEIFFGTTVGDSFYYYTVGKGIHPIYVGFKYARGKYALTYYVNPAADANGVVVAYQL